MTDHRVQRIGAPVDEHRRHPGDRGPHHGRHVRVGCVLGDRFECGANQAGRIEHGRVASAQRRQQSARARNIAGVQQAGHLVAGAAQRRSAERDERRRRGCHHRPPRATPRCRPFYGDTEQTNRPEQSPDVQRPCAAGIGVGQPLQSRCAAAEQRDRVPATRIAEQDVSDVTGRDPGAAAPTCWRKHPGSVSQVVYSDS